MSEWCVVGARVVVQHPGGQWGLGRVQAVRLIEGDPEERRVITAVPDMGGSLTVVEGDKRVTVASPCACGAEAARYDVVANTFGYDCECDAGRGPAIATSGNWA